MSIPQERDALDGAMLMLVAAVTLAIVLATVGVAAWMLEARRAALGFSAPPPERVPVTLSHVHVTPLRDEGDAAKLREAKVERLSSWGWVDRERGVVHLPIELSMELVAADAVPVSPEGAP